MAPTVRLLSRTTTNNVLNILTAIASKHPDDRSIVLALAKGN